MNTYLLGALVIFAITLLALNYRITTNVTNDTARVSLRIGMFVVFVASVLLFYKQPTITNNGTQPRHYKDSPTLKWVSSYPTRRNANYPIDEYSR